MKKQETHLVHALMDALRESKTRRKHAASRRQRRKLPIDRHHAAESGRRAA